ncbi:MAG: GGDEF domain-containing protein [Gammaproteobacteria bacterium]|nr:GGDEF domain-containing protein [Gammaproteobacteria bacterium]
MNSTPTDQHRDPDYLRGFRKRNVMYLAWGAVPFLVPFGLYSLATGRFLVSAFLALVTAIALINAVAIHRRGRICIPIWVYYGLILAALIYAMATLGVSASYWSYPACLSVLFVASRWEARILISVSLAVLLPTAFLFLPVDVATRFAITLVMVCFFCDLIVGLFGELQTRLTELAFRDPLTGALNRRQMASLLQQAVEDLQRHGHPASLACFDLDYFKKVNDKLGHEAGDQVLRNLVSTVQNRIRGVDSLFRLGGEEFAVLLRNTSLANGMSFAESLRDLIEQAPLLQEQPVTVSIGVAECCENESVDDWLRRADEALYEAKGAGRNRVHPPVYAAAS